MYLLIAIFFFSFCLLSYMTFLKTVEVESGERNHNLALLSHKTDPIAGRIIDFSAFFAPELIMDTLRFLSAKLGILVAKLLFMLKNLSSSLAAHLYHTSKKVEAGEPISHPSFFIKAIMDFKEKMKEGEEMKK